MAKYTWAPAKKKSRPKASDAVKNDVEMKADSLIDTVLKPKYIQPPPENSSLNYLVDISGKWHRGFSYFTSKYRSPSPNAIAPFFNSNFARMEYVGNDRFNLAYIRHTGQWNEINSDLSMEECLDGITNLPHFMP